MAFFAEKEINKQGMKILYDIFSNNHKPGYVMSAAHIHSYYEIVLMTGGEDLFVCNNAERYFLHEGDVLVIPPNIVHSACVPKNSAYESNASITMKFSPQLLYPLSNTMSDIHYLINTDHLSHRCLYIKAEDERSEKFSSLIRAAYEERREESPCFELALRGYLSVLYSLIVRCSPAETQNQESGKKISAKNIQLICDALSYIEANYRNPISIQQVADALGVTYAQLTYLFSKCFVKGFSEYLLDLRINRAQKYLLSSNRTVTDIAIDCGFDNASYFAKKFKSVTGMTPKEYRHKYLDNQGDN